MRAMIFSQQITLSRFSGRLTTHTNSLGGRIYRLRVPTPALYMWKYQGGVYFFYGNLWGAWIRLCWVFAAS